MYISSVSQLQESLDIPSIEERAKTLVKSYLNRAEHNNNPMIIELIDDFELYKNYKFNSKIKRETILDFFTPIT